jgi:hypothetical protein
VIRFPRALLRKMQIKTTMSYPFTLVSISVIEKVKNVTSVGKDVEQLGPLYTIGLRKMVQPICKTV